MENVSHRAWGRPSVSQIQDSPSKTTHSRLMKQLRREPLRQQAIGTESTYIPRDVTIGVTPVAVAYLSSFTDTVFATKPYCMMKQRPEALTPTWQECNVLGRQVTTPTSESTWISITILPTPTSTDTTSDVTSATATTTSSDASVTDTSSTSSESSSTYDASSSSTFSSTTSDSTSSYTTSSESFSETSFSASSSSTYTSSFTTSSTYTISSSPTSYSWASPSTYWPNPTTSWYTVVSTSWVTASETVTQFSGTTVSSTSASPLQSFVTTTTITSTGLLSTDTPDEGNSLSRNTGAVIGVAVSAAVVVVLIAIGVFFVCRRYRRSASEPSTEQPQFVPSWRPPLAGDDDSSLGVTITATSTVGHRVSSGQIPYIDPREMGHSPPSSEGLAPSSHGHSSNESSSHALLTRSRSSSVGKHMRAEEAPSEEEVFLNRLRTRRSAQVSELVIPPVPRIPSTIQLPPTSPISPASSTYPSSLLNPPPPLSLEPPTPAYTVQSSSSWPPPPMQVPAFGMHAPEGLLHPLVGLEQTESVTSFRDHMDYSRPILPRRVDRGEEESI
ncbi:hypothetical protein IW261DRAFT_1431642 [Armillaria novae-zelandiae]|uniref:Transmembrane protein n=1 Tax=Armillaria novae-zelandiae TaxID=153914 RepID=A0AA39PTY4_9AGAR|nr:hypothetical protein IW261DRAFT_1431642 [Armillaria novae-zelandiae]